MIKKSKIEIVDSNEQIRYQKIEVPLISDAPFCLISEIKQKKVKQFVSLRCYVPSDNVKSQYIDSYKKLTNKTEVLVNDESGTMKIIFWKDMYEKIDQGEGTYSIVNLRVAMFNKKLYLVTTSNTKIKKDSKEIKKSTDLNIHDHYQRAVFPPDDVRKLVSYMNCPNCSRSLTEMSNKRLMKCLACNLAVLAETVRPSYKATLFFKNEKVSITCFPDKIQQFIDLTNAEIKSDEDLLIELLTAKNLQIYFNDKFNCIGISKLI